MKKKFREGHHADAIAGCEALCRTEPRNYEVKRLCAMMLALAKNYGRALELLHEIRNAGEEDADALFNMGVCQRELGDFGSADRTFEAYTARFPDHPDGWASRAECQFQLGEFDKGMVSADRAIKLDPSSRPAWTIRGNCQKAIGQPDAALASYRKANELEPTAECWLNSGLILLETGKPSEAIECFGRGIKLSPEVAGLRVARGDALQRLGKLQEAVADYKAALALAPSDGETLKRASLCLLELNQGSQAMDLCRDVLKVHPEMLTAKLGADWVLSKLVPAWHIPMMNEEERNKAYHDGLQSVVAPDKVVLEIGTGSGLLAMMAARLGARKVFTCEAVDLVAQTAQKIVERNGYQDRITIIAKPSQAVQLGSDLPARADILVHEIFSSELLGEHVLSAIEDAKHRLLRPGGEVMPSAASIMIALVGGDELGRTLHVAESHGFDLRDFNAIQPRRRPLYREDLALALLSDDIEAFRFDFRRESRFPAEKKVIDMAAAREGLCYGVVQWIRIELNREIQFENHPSRSRSISNWQHTIFGFEEPVHLDMGSVVKIAAMHDRSRPWFELNSG